jgi:hypothetical protein
VGVGSLCKRQGDPAIIAGILDAINGDRPDLRLHGFGCKRTSLLDERVRRRLATADSMAWSMPPGSKVGTRTPGLRRRGSSWGSGVSGGGDLAR